MHFFPSEIPFSQLLLCSVININTNVRRNLKPHLVQPPHFGGKETEAQRG